MVNSYDNMMGDPMDPGDHPATNVPQATQHYAGDVVPMGIAPSQQSSQNASDSRIEAHSYALGTEKSPKVLSIGNTTLKNWADRTAK